MAPEMPIVVAGPGYTDVPHALFRGRGVRAYYEARTGMPGVSEPHLAYVVLGPYPRWVKKRMLMKHGPSEEDFAIATVDTLTEVIRRYRERDLQVRYVWSGNL